MNGPFKYLGGSREPTTISRIANVLFNHTLVRFVNYLIIEIYSFKDIHQKNRKSWNGKFGNFCWIPQATTYKMLHLTNFLYHLGLEELGVQEFIDEKHFKGGKLIQISWANSANFLYKLEKEKKINTGRFTLVIFRRSMKYVD